MRNERDMRFSFDLILISAMRWSLISLIDCSRCNITRSAIQIRLSYWTHNNLPYSKKIVTQKHLHVGHLHTKIQRYVDGVTRLFTYYHGYTSTTQAFFFHLRYQRYISKSEN